LDEVDLETLEEEIEELIDDLKALEEASEFSEA